MQTENATCCIIGAGPAGMMLGLLLARVGVDVIVLEKHADFLRDFRGDTIHPSTQELIYQLGWIEDFQQIPHSTLCEVSVAVGDTTVTIAEFRKLRVKCPYIAFVPQWDFLNFLAGKAAKFPGFRLLRRTEMTELIREGGRIVGARAQSPDGPMEIRADLVVAADGRHSVSRSQARLKPIASSPPIDVLWFRLSRSDGEQVPFFRIGNGALISINRGDYWQIAYTIPVNTYPQLQKAGIAELRRRIGSLAPEFSDRLSEIDSWDSVSHLSVRVDRLKRWHRPGLLCIGDAAHAMSPAGGVGINIAIQDAVAAANLLGPGLLSGTVTEQDLTRVQKRRDLPARITQLFQLSILRDLYPKHLDDNKAERLPLIFLAFRALPPLRYLMGRFIGLGIRMEKFGAQPWRNHES